MNMTKPLHPNTTSTSRMKKLVRQHNMSKPHEHDGNIEDKTLQRGKSHPLVSDLREAEKHREAQRNTQKHREARGSTRKHGKAQGRTGKHGEAQGRTRKHKETQGSTGEHREAQGSTGKHREAQICTTLMF